ncbi:MAG TPA: efflux transporter outer membrane subunit [Spongiibacteraceae bacterium]|nr:efflux transporter outer membrane subunit [Spongiibacteraceae bacterium]
MRYRSTKHAQIPQVRSIVCAAVILAIGGCANYRDIDSKAELRKPESFATQETFDVAASDWPTQQWWLQFNDAQLNALIDEAIAHNPSLDIAAARVRSAQAYTGVAHSANYPDIDATGTISYQKFSENWIFPPPWGGSSFFNSTLHLNAAYELDFWGKNRAGVKVAVSQERAAQAEQQSAVLLLTSNVTKIYIELDRLFAEHDVMAQTLQEREKVFTLTQQRFDAGIDNRGDVKQAESQLPVLRGQLAQIDEAIGATRNALAALLGQGPDRGLQIKRPHLAIAQTEIKLPANLPVNLLGRRPDVVAARWQAEAAQQQVNVAKAQFYPNVSLTGYVGFSSLGLDNLTKASSLESGIGPAIQLPIFAGGRLRYNLKNQYANYDIAVANYNATLTTALRDVADQLNALQSLQKRQIEQKSAAAIAHSALNFSTQRYEAGLGNYLSVLNAEMLVLAQEQLGIELNARARNIQIDLIKALGGGYDATQKTAALPN